MNSLCGQATKVPMTIGSSGAEGGGKKCGGMALVEDLRGHTKDSREQKEKSNVAN
jgi:hypothetical protein